MDDKYKKSRPPNKGTHYSEADANRQTVNQSCMYRAVPWYHRGVLQFSLHCITTVHRKIVRLYDGIGSNVRVVCEYSTSAVPNITLVLDGLLSGTLNSTVVQMWALKCILLMP